MIHIELEFRTEIELYGYENTPENILTSVVNVVLDLDNPDWIVYDKNKLKNPVELYKTGIYFDAIKNKYDILEVPF